ncbi:MAG TPA: hypothetical protein VGZ73_18070 [Bryobacteraceae bacterium]|jgi:small multidrug resistance family-3 protein|nr:hypothetical protein [Bryobacteraceae bacterium]
MTTLKTLAVLFTAALLEVGGDALVRKGLHAPAILRAGFLLAGAMALFAYGCVVNTPPWDFGRLLGVYVTFVFVVAQIVSWLAFGQVPTARLVLGGACIVIGGLIVSGSQV